MEFNETEFKNKAKKEISKCRPGDWNHALRVVDWVKKLGKKRLDLNLIIAAAYIHDIGWKGLVKDNKITFNQLLSLEKKANKNSEKFAAKFLSKQVFTNDEILNILRLIRAADKHASNLTDEEIIVDADNLSKLDINHLNEKYNQDEWEKVCQKFEISFPERIKTARGKSLYPPLLENLKKQIRPG